MTTAGGEYVIDALTTICNKIWSTKHWQKLWTQSLESTIPKKEDLQLCKNYRTISFISKVSKVMLKVLLNRLQPQVEAILAEEQAGFRTC